MKVPEIKKDIFWVGAVDWNIRDFHGYSTYNGSTYNAFLMKDEKNVLFDTVKYPLRQNMLHHLRSVINPEDIDYIVVNHVEMDHSGALPEVMELVKPEKLICSKMGKKALIDHFHRDDWPYEVVEPGQTISVGKRSIQFIETRMLHWPDSMFSYIPEEKLLISSDAFGQHYASSERFDDEADMDVVMQQAAKYYANILMLYSPLVKKLLKGVSELGIEIDMIAPDHGIIWRSHVDKILQLYSDWANYKARKKVLIIYDTMWHSTEKMARAILEGVQIEGGVSVELISLDVNHRSEVITKIMDAKGIVFGSPTLNNSMLPSVAGMLTYMKGLKPGEKIGACFGSFGWSGEAVKQMTAIMQEAKFEMIEPGVRIKYVPTHEQLKDCVDLGRRIAKAVKESNAV